MLFKQNTQKTVSMNIVFPAICTLYTITFIQYRDIQSKMNIK